LSESDNLGSLREIIQGGKIDDEEMKPAVLNDIQKLNNVDLNLEHEVAELTAKTIYSQTKIKQVENDMSRSKEEILKITNILSNLKFELKNLDTNFVTERTIREMITRQIDTYDKNVQNKIINNQHEVKREIFNLTKQMNQMQTNLREIESKLFNQSNEFAALSESISPISALKDDVANLSSFTEKTIYTEIKDLQDKYTGEALNKIIQKWISVYHERHKSVKLDFDKLYSENKNLVDNIKKEYQLVESIKSDVKKQLFNDIVEYNAKFREFVNDKKFKNYIEDLSKRSNKVLENIIKEQETRKFFEDLKVHIDKIKNE
jgi:chromosome segregation ATPase